MIRTMKLLCDGSDGTTSRCITTDYVLAETATLIRMRDKSARSSAGGAGCVFHPEARLRPSAEHYCCRPTTGTAGLSAIFRPLVQLCRLHELCRMERCHTCLCF